MDTNELARQLFASLDRFAGELRDALHSPTTPADTEGYDGVATPPSVREAEGEITKIREQAAVRAKNLAEQASEMHKLGDAYATASAIWRELALGTLDSRGEDMKTW